MEPSAGLILELVGDGAERGIGRVGEEELFVRDGEGAASGEKHIIGLVKKCENVS